MSAKDREVHSESNDWLLVIRFQNHLISLKEKLTAASLLLDINHRMTKTAKSLDI